MDLYLRNLHRRAVTLDTKDSWKELTQALCRIHGFSLEEVSPVKEDSPLFGKVKELKDFYSFYKKTYNSYLDPLYYIIEERQVFSFELPPTLSDKIKSFSNIALTWIKVSKEDGMLFLKVSGGGCYYTFPLPFIGNNVILHNERILITNSEYQAEIEKLLLLIKICATYLLQGEEAALAVESN